MQIAQNFPIVARLARARARRDSVAASRPFAVDHRAAFLGKAKGGQDDAWRSVAALARISMTTKTGSFDSVRPKSDVDRVFAERDQGAARCPEITRLDNRRQACARIG